jgi:hypothetical protein
MARTKQTARKYLFLSYFIHPFYLLRAVCLVRAIFDDKLDEKWFLLMKELVGGGWM